MAFDAEELMADGSLASFELGKGHFDEHIDTQISRDAAGVSLSNESDPIKQRDTAAGQTQTYQSHFPHKKHDKASLAMNLHLPRDEDFIDVESFESEIGDKSAPIKIEPESDTSLTYSSDAIIKQEEPISDAGILGSNFETQVIDLCESDEDQDAMDVEEDSNSRVKTEESDVPFVWRDIGSDIIELSDSSQKEVQELSPTQMRSVRRTSNNSSSETSSSARVLESGKVTGAGRIFGGFRGKAPQFTESAEIDDDDSDFSDKGASFLSLKRKYKTKLRNGIQDEEDDIVFLAATEKEEARLQRAEADRLLRNRAVAAGEDIPAEDLDESLFLPDFSSSQTATTSRLGVMGEIENDDTDTSTHTMTKSRSTKRAKHRKPQKRQNRKALQAQEEVAMRAGLEEYLEHGNGEIEEDSGHKTKAKKKAQSKKGKSKASGAKASKLKNRVTNIGSLGSRIDAANADRPALKIDNAKTKNMALKALLAGVPLEGQREARSDRAKIIRASRLLGFRMVSPDGLGAWKLKGMATHLWNHQVIASGFMRERETGTRKPLGGLLADEMGVGKTVEVIATMIANPPAEDDVNKCTLIVAPSGLVNQWMTELTKHCEPRFFKRIFRYDATSKFRGEGVEYIMQEADVVFTTYQEVISSYPQMPALKDGDDDEVQQKWAEAWNNGRGVLHKVHFYRIVLDEAHGIKNHRSQTSIACRGLMAKHRWALTATPIPNSVEEFYPYFKFLQIKETGTFKTFKSNFCNPDDKACTRRLHAMLQQWMIRRLKSDTLLGAPIIKLPPSHQTTLTIDFNAVERIIYDKVYNRYIRAINTLVAISGSVKAIFDTLSRLSRSGKLEESVNLLLTMLLRLRQLTGHPFLAQPVIESFFEVEDVELLWSLTSNGSVDRSSELDMAKAVQNLVKAKALATMRATEEEERTSTENGVAAADSENPNVSNKYRVFLDLLRTKRKWADLKDRTLCVKCKCPPDEPWITNCLHCYCRECLEMLSDDAAKNGEGIATCIECNKPYGSAQAAGGIKELEIDSVSLDSNSNDKKKPRAKSLEEEMKWIDIGGTILPSSKTQAVQMQVEAWLSQEPHKKIIIFSQFHMLMRILGRMCEEKGWGYCPYNGKMPMEARDKAINMFRDNPETKILIASLKCGGIGLNLTMASKIICVDLWYNSSVEQQAFGRVSRIGQESETFVTRLIVRGTVDERLDAMQMEKDKAIGQALETDKNIAAFTVKELMKLFGPVMEDQEGRAFILVDDEKEPREDTPEPKRRVNR